MSLLTKKLSVGYTLYYASFAEKIPGVFDVVSDYFQYDFDTYRREHEKGDWVMDLRAGYEINNKVRATFICRNLTNHLYATRPGVMEPPRSYTLQLRYKF